MKILYKQWSNIATNKDIIEAIREDRQAKRSPKSDEWSIVVSISLNGNCSKLPNWKKLIKYKTDSENENKIPKNRGCRQSLSLGIFLTILNLKISSMINGYGNRLSINKIGKGEKRQITESKSIFMEYSFV
jgi:hypothetical protein